MRRRCRDGDIDEGRKVNSHPLTEAMDGKAKGDNIFHNFTLCDGTSQRCPFAIVFSRITMFAMVLA